MEALKWTLRRLVVPKTVPAGGSSGTISHSNSYQRSVDAENAGSHLTKAYASLQRLALRPDAAAYLDEIFEVWLLTRSKEDTEIGGQLGLMLGFWVSGSSPGEEFTDWGELYEKWTEAGKWIRYLYCAWLR